MNYDLSHVLAFFVASVGFVLGNLVAGLLNDVEIPEVNFLAKLQRTFVTFLKFSYGCIHALLVFVSHFSCHIGFKLFIMC